MLKKKLSAAVNILLTQHGARGLVFAVGAVDLLVAPFLLHNKMKIIHYRYLPNDQGCGSAFTLYGSGSSSFSECGSGSRSRSSLTKFEEKKHE